MRTDVAPRAGLRGLLLVAPALLLAAAPQPVPRPAPADAPAPAPGSDPVPVTPSNGGAPPHSTPAPDPLAAWTSRLRALSPDQPRAYFLLAEEVAEDADDPAARDLARRLFVLAYELNQRADVARRWPTLAPSVCLALASIAVREDERRWLRAMAQSLSEPIGFSPANTSLARGDDRDAPADVCLDAASVLGLCRGGDGRRAEALLEKPGVYDLLKEIDISRATPFSIESFIERTRRDWPTCPQCRNRRAVPSGGGKAGEMVRCDTCRGTPGVQLTDVELIYQLRLESALLAGTQRSWAAQLITDGGAPLRDLDPSELAATYDVPPEKPYWREARWVEKP